MKAAFVLALGIVLLSGCAHKRTARAPAPPPRPSAKSKQSKGNTAPPPATTAPATVVAGDVENGIASWYGHPYHGRPAANGEIYDMEKLTAAHRTLPFDTWVHVVNLLNEKAVDVRITDRGPFVDGRIIDLSHAAAKAIDLIGPGIAQVRVEIMKVPAAPEPGIYAVQVGAYRDRTNAERHRTRMAAQYGAARLVFRDGNPSLWRVLVGAEKTEDDADALRMRITRDSGERNVFVVRLDS